MRNRIIVNKALIPYGFHIVLGKERFNLRFAYNRQADLFTVSLYRDGALLCIAEPIIYGVPLDESGGEQEVTWGNFGETVFLTVEDGR